MDNFEQPPSERPNEARGTPPGGASPYQPTGPYGYPPLGEPYYPQANPPAPGYGQPGPPSQYGQPGYPPQYGQPGYPPQYGQPGPPSQYGQFGAPAPMSGQYQGYGQQPPPWPGAPGGGGPDQRRPVWPWIVGGVGALLIVCVVLGVIGLGVLRSSPIASQVQASLTATAEATSAPTSAPAAAPTNTNSAPGVGDHMYLGHNYRKTTAGDFQIVSPTNDFKSSDEFAFVIRLSGPIGTTHATLALAKVESGGAESVQETAPIQISNPNFNEFANKLTTSQLMVGMTPGLYKLEVRTSSATVASAEFNYEG